ncbi:ECF transporter S component [Micromonospora sp. LOL_013]|uniref:ECF transporter S component n=1 Tax=Micromonospora sp. LOL_013 TaxID=3345414 RepID=UPI003A86BC9A
MTQQSLPADRSWRTVDIVVASVIAVAFGVVFWLWGLIWAATEAAFTFFPPAQAVLYGVWLVPAVLGALVIRKPGAALFCELVAAVVSAALGSQWGAVVIVQGLAQGVGAELVFLAVAYRSFRLPVALAAGAAAGLGAAIFDQIRYYAPYDLVSFRIPIFIVTVVSAIVLAGAGSVALTRALARTGVLDRFPSGRDRTTV